MKLLTLYIDKDFDILSRYNVLSTLRRQNLQATFTLSCIGLTRGASYSIVKILKKVKTGVLHDALKLVDLYWPITTWRTVAGISGSLIGHKACMNVFLVGSRVVCL